MKQYFLEFGGIATNAKSLTFVQGKVLVSDLFPILNMHAVFFFFFFEYDFFFFVEKKRQKLMLS